MNISTIQLIMKTFYNFTKINIACYDSETSTLSRLYDINTVLGLKSLKIIVNENFNENFKDQIIETNLYEKYIICSNSYNLHFICGPFINNEPTIQEITALFLRNTSINRREVIKHFHNLPHFSTSNNTLIMALISSLCKLNDTDVSLIIRDSQMSKTTLDLFVADKDTDKIDNPTIKRVHDYIQNHYDSKITVKDIADSINLNKEYLSHYFKKTTSISLKTYINQMKMRIAQELLISTHDKVHDIAFHLGYTDAANFSRVFKKICGITPKVYRIQNIKK